MKWYQVDSDAPNDPKVRGLLRTGGQQAAGGLFLLWCFIANHGKGDPGLGVRTGGGALDLGEMADECYFASSAELRAFLDRLAERNLIHAEVWRQREIVFLPAMWNRLAAYYRSKARKMAYASVDDLVAAVLVGGGPELPKADGPGLIQPKPKPDGPIQPKPDHGGRILPMPGGFGPTSQDSTEHDSTGGSKALPLARPDDADFMAANLLADAGADQVDALVKVWNEERKPGPAVREVTAGRRRAAIVALKANPNLDDWRRVIRYINGQKWCNAQGGGDHPNWRLDLDYLLKPGKFTKSMEAAAMARPESPGGLVGRDASRGRTGVKVGAFAAALAGGGEE